MVINSDQDPRIEPHVIPPLDNNIGMANIWHLAERAGDDVPFSFNAGSGGDNGFGFESWPRRFRMKVNNNLPSDWKFVAKEDWHKYPLELKLGDERNLHFSVNIPESAAPRSGGIISIQQIDLATNRTVGSVVYKLYEDHLPPIKVKDIVIEPENGIPILTWKAVNMESETGLKDRIAYYEIFRDGKPVAKALWDSDPSKIDWQWKDKSDLRGKHSYTISAVDEGGNK